MSAKMKPDDPAYWMLFDGFETKPNLEIFNDNCCICNDSEFAQMGLPLCYPCLVCGAHVPADDCVCDNGHEQPQSPLDELYIREKYGLKITDELKKLAKEEVQNLDFIDEWVDKNNNDHPR